MEKIKLSISERESKTPNQLRREAKIPATLYGGGEVSTSIQIDEREFSRLPAAAFSHVIELDMSGKPASALIRHVQRQSTTSKVLNVEFYKVRLDQEITVVVPLQFVGVAEAVTIKGGQVIHGHEEVEIECLPNDIPDYIEVDLSKLVEIDDAIHFGELKVPAGIKILHAADDVVAKATEIREVVEEEPEKAAEEGAEEGEGAAEGAAASPTAGSAAAPGDQAGAPAAKGKDKDK